MASRSATALRRALVAALDEQRVLADVRIRRAFVTVPRERFLPGVELDRVYRNEAILTRRSASGLPMSSSSQPSLMASMLAALNVKRGDHVLEIGTGTGYNAALLAHLVGAHGKVTSVELEADIAAAARRSLAGVGDRVDVTCGDGWLGGDPQVIYDAMIVTANVNDIPRAWWEQLAMGGHLVVPLRFSGSDDLFGRQLIVVFERTASGFATAGTIPGGFMHLRRPGDRSDIAAPLQEPAASTMPPAIVAHDADGVIVQLSGPSIKAMSRQRRRQLLELLLRPPRARRRLSSSEIVNYVDFALPAGERLAVVIDGIFGLGAAVANARGLSCVLHGPRGAELRHYGPAARVDPVERAVTRWRAAQRRRQPAIIVTVAVPAPGGGHDDNLATPARRDDDVAVSMRGESLIDVKLA